MDIVVAEVLTLPGVVDGRSPQLMEYFRRWSSWPASVNVAAAVMDEFTSTGVTGAVMALSTGGVLFTATEAEYSVASLSLSKILPLTVRGDPVLSAAVHDLLAVVLAVA